MMGKLLGMKQAAANDAPVTEDIVPAFEIAVAANFADMQQVHIRVPVKDPITRTEANRLVDLATDLAQRQVSRMEIRINEAALKDKHKALALQEKRREEELAKHDQAIADAQAAIVAAETRYAELEQKGAAEHVASGRRGEFKPQGALRNRLDGLRKDIEAQRDKVRSLEADHLQKVAKAQDDIIERLTEEIAAIERVIEKHREIVG